MQHPYRLNLVSLLGLTLAGAYAHAASPPAQYKLADQNFYLRAAVLKAQPSAVILGAGEYKLTGDSYFVPTHHKAPAEVYVEVVKDWLEPVTPPSMPDSLGLAPDVMQVREPQGDVQVAPPDNPTGFVPATEAMPIVNGSVVKTGANGSAAVLFGGVDSARLMPNSQAMVQQTVMPELRSTRIDLKSGAVFSKVGLRPGEKQDFQVHTPFGVASAKGTDFVCVAMPDRTDVWIAQGTVQFTQPDGQIVGTVKSAGKGVLRIIRFPVIKDAKLALAATTETMTAALNFIPMVNLKLKTLQDQAAQGVKMTPQETTYLSFIKRVPCLLRLALIPPPPAPVPTPAPPKPATAVLAPQPIMGTPANLAPRTADATPEKSAVTAKPVKKIHKKEVSFSTGPNDTAP